MQPIKSLADYAPRRVAPGDYREDTNLRHSNCPPGRPCAAGVFASRAASNSLATLLGSRSSS